MLFNRSLLISWTHGSHNIRYSYCSHEIFAGKEKPCEVSGFHNIGHSRLTNSLKEKNLQKSKSSHNIGYSTLTNSSQGKKNLVKTLVTPDSWIICNKRRTLWSQWLSQYWKVTNSWQGKNHVSFSLKIVGRKENLVKAMALLTLTTSITITLAGAKNPLKIVAFTITMAIKYKRTLFNEKKFHEK